MRFGLSRSLRVASVAVVMAMGASVSVIPGGSAAARPDSAKRAINVGSGVAEGDVTDGDVSALRSLGRRKPNLGGVPKSGQQRMVGLARELAPCVKLTIGVYCVGLGLRDSRPDFAKLVAPVEGARFSSGDLTFRDWVLRRSRMNPQDRQELQMSEVEDEIAALDKEVALERFLDSLDTDAPLTTYDSPAAQGGSAGDEGDEVGLIISLVRGVILRLASLW